MQKSIVKRAGQNGFTLVELMVGLVLGMLTVLVIAQVLVLAEGKKRSVSMGSDAQVNGAMALYTLQREIQMAGYGATQSLDALGCPVKAQFDTNAAFTFTLAPVVIEDGANGAPDKITILRGRSTGFSIPVALAGAHTSTDNHFSVNASFGTTAGTWMIAVPAAQDATHWCSLFSVTNDTSDVTTTLSATVIPHVLTANSKWNQNSVFPAAGYQKGDYLLNMGSFVSRVYSINTSNNAEALQVADLSLANGLTSPQDLYPQIVNLQALYGKGTVDPSGNVIVDTYDNVTPLTNADWRRVVAVRIAVVARSAEYEKDIVTTTRNSPQWDVGSTATIPGASTCPNGTSKCLALKVDQLTDWQHYRYKVYDTIVPLRNVLWNS